MVFYHTNFVKETNEWWLKRVRPVWWSAAALGAWFIYYRYYFYGKTQAKWAISQDPAVMEDLAQHNKRKWGYGYYFEPTLKNSIKKQQYELLGANYKHAESWATRYFVDDRTVEEIYREETENFDI